MSGTIHIHHHPLPIATGKLISCCYWLEKAVGECTAPNLMIFTRHFIDHAIQHQPVNAYCVWQAVRHMISPSETLSGFEPKCLAIGDSHAISTFLLDRAQEQIDSLVQKDPRKWHLAAETLTCQHIDIAALGWLEAAFRVVNAELDAMLYRSPDARYFRRITYLRIEGVTYHIDITAGGHNALELFETCTLPKLDAVESLQPSTALHTRSVIPLAERDPRNPADWILSIGWLGNPIVRECLDTLSRLNPREYCGFF